jgi:hypothetical protein
VNNRGNAAAAMRVGRTACGSTASSTRHVRCIPSPHNASAPNAKIGRPDRWNRPQRPANRCGHRFAGTGGATAPRGGVGHSRATTRRPTAPRCRKRGATFLTQGCSLSRVGTPADVHCPTCHSDRTKIALQTGDWIYVRCLHCHHAWPVPERRRRHTARTPERRNPGQADAP